MQESHDLREFGPHGDDRPLWTVERVAKRLRVSDPDVRALIRRGEIPSFRRGARRLVPPAAVDAFVAARGGEPERGALIPAPAPSSPTTIRLDPGTTHEMARVIAKSIVTRLAELGQALALDVEALAQQLKPLLDPRADDRPLLTIRDVAERLNISPRSARDMINGRDGKPPRLPSVVVNEGSRRVIPSDLDAYISSLRRACS